MTRHNKVVDMRRDKLARTPYCHPYAIHTSPASAWSNLQAQTMRHAWSQRFASSTKPSYKKRHDDKNTNTPVRIAEQDMCCARATLKAGGGGTWPAG